VAARKDPPSPEHRAHRQWTAPAPGVLRTAGPVQQGARDDKSIIRLHPTAAPNNLRYVGPQLDDPAWAAETTWRRSDSEPLVLVATSSIFQHQTSLLRRIAQALGHLPVRGLITTGLAVHPKEIQAPPNIEVVQAAPHRQVLAEGSVVVTHAGHGTVLKALAAGVPLVCVPMGRDQRDNTVRVLRLGAGVRVSEKAPPDQIAAAVSEILEQIHTMHQLRAVLRTFSPRKPRMC
jgi:MGT family glycosyltransferase